MFPTLETPSHSLPLPIHFPSTAWKLFSILKHFFKLIYLLEDGPHCIAQGGLELSIEPDLTIVAKIHDPPAVACQVLGSLGQSHHRKGLPLVYNTLSFA